MPRIPPIPPGRLRGGSTLRTRPGAPSVPGSATAPRSRTPAGGRREPVRRDRVPTPPVPPGPPGPPVTPGEAAEALRRAAEAQVAIRRRLAEEKLARARALKQEIAAELYELAEILRDIHDQQLWRFVVLRDPTGAQKPPHASWEDFLEREGLVSKSLAHELISVVRVFPRDVALEVGIQRCHAVVLLARATPEDDTPNELLDAHPELRDLAVREIEERARRVRDGIGTASGAPSDTSALIRELATELQAVLRNRGADGAKVRPKSRAGDWWLVIELLASDAATLRSP